MWLAGVSATATLVAMLSGVATIGSFLAYLYTAQRSNANAAREEALALAETRRQVIADLRRQNAKCEQRTRELEQELQNVRAEARNQRYRVQRLFAIGLADLLADVPSDPRALPPDVEEALQRIRQLLV
jgi:uncharacterized protein (DUF3084 family)